MKMIKNLSKVIVRNYEGFNLREDLNFSDDGNYFRGFDYKGLPITTLRSNIDGTTYLSIRVDYLHNEFTFEDWMATEEYKLEDEFNGVSEFDLDKLIENCEKIIAKVNELNEKTRNEVVNMDEVETRILEEAEMIEVVVEYTKENLKWWNLRDCYLEKAKKYIKWLMEKHDIMLEEDLEKMDNRRKREMVQRFEKYGYVHAKEDDFYITQLKKFVEESQAV